MHPVRPIMSPEMKELMRPLTPAEIRRNKRNRNVAYTPKNVQGRNEKCNCGSGKKYKQCCGGE